MFTLLLCLFICTWLPYLAKIPVALAMSKAGGYDNSLPREQQKRLDEKGARALAAHKNSFESLLLFACAVMSAVVTQTITPLVTGLAITFVVARIVYHVAYLIDLSTLRSLVWAVGFFSAMTMMGVSIF